MAKQTEEEYKAKQAAVDRKIRVESTVPKATASFDQQKTFANTVVDTMGKIVDLQGKFLDIVDYASRAQGQSELYIPEEVEIVEEVEDKMDDQTSESSYSYSELDAALASGGDAKELVVQVSSSVNGSELEREMEQSAHLDYYLRQEEKENLKLRMELEHLRLENESLRRENETLRGSLRQHRDGARETCQQWADRCNCFEQENLELKRQVHNKRGSSEGDDRYVYPAKKKIRCS